MKEQSLENMARGRAIYEPPRYMSVSLAIEQLLSIEEERQCGAYGPDTIAVGVARLGSDDQQIISGTMKELMKQDFGEPLHSLVIAGNMHFLEADALKEFAINTSSIKILR